MLNNFHNENDTKPLRNRLCHNYDFLMLNTDIKNGKGDRHRLELANSLWRQEVLLHQQTF